MSAVPPARSPTGPGASLPKQDPVGDALPRGVLPRERLESLIGDAALVVVVAPAGYGKSTFAAQWAESRRARGEGAVWLNLTAAHGDPVLLLRDLARRLVASSASGTGNDDLDRGQLDAIAGQDALFAAILDLLAAGPQPSWLILNDLHLLERTPALDYVGRLVDAAGQNFRLFLTSRSEPAINLARRASRGEVCWITEIQLAFTPDEIRVAARQVEPAPPAAAVEALATSGNGWPIFVGVAIAALRAASPSASALGTAGIASQGLIRSFVRELMREATRDEAERTLLEALAALDQIPYRLLGWLAPAEAASEARQRLLGSGLVRQHPDADWGEVYSLHPVVREIVRQELGGSTGRIAALQSRAAEWYWSQGQRDRAIADAAAAGDGARATAWLAEYADELVRRLGLLETFLHHLDRLPPGVVAATPALAENRAWSLALLRRYGEAERAITALPADGAGEPLRQMLRGVMAVLQDDDAAAFSLLATCLPDNPAWTDFERGVAALALSYCHRGRGELDQAHGALRQALAAFAVERSTYGRIWVAVFEALLLLKEGRFRNALAECSAATESAATSVAFGPLRGMLRSVEAFARYERGDLEGARTALDEGLRLLHQQGIVDAIITGYVAAARVRAATGALADALDLIAEGERIGYDRGFLRLEETLRAERILLLIRSGHPDQAKTLATHAGFLPLADAATPLRRDEGVRIAARLARHPEAAIPRPELDQRLDAAIGRARQTGEHYKLAELLLQRALLAVHDGDENGARLAALETLALAAAEGYLRLFVDEGAPARQLLARLGNAAGSGTAAVHLRQILDACAPPPEGKAAQPAEQGPEPLSERETQVLRLVAEGCPNGVIARRMFLTEGTVKWHLHNIYGKLGVSGRRPAVEAARRLGALPAITPLPPGE